MTHHEPKLRALAALNRRQLSAAAEARLRKHLSSCEACRHALSGERIAEHLIAEAVRSEPRLNVAKIQAGLAKRQTTERRRRWVLTAISPLAAAAAALWLLARPDPPAGTSHRPGPILAPVPPSPAYPASVTALAGPATVQPTQGPAAAMRVGTIVHDGDQLALGPGSVAHVRLDHATGCIAGPGTEFTVRRAHEGETELDLRRGRLVSQVQPLTAAQRYLIRATGYTIAVHGTRFEVAVSGDALEVVVSEGRVVLSDSSGAIAADLNAQDHFAIDPKLGARLATRDAAQPALQLEPPRGLGVDLDAWPLLTFADVTVLSRFGVTGLTADGSRFPITGELAVRVPRGEVTLVVERLRVAPQRIVLQVPVEGLSLSADALRRLLKLSKAADPPPAAAADLQPAIAVVHAGTAGLQRCYERALKQRPDLDGRLTLRIAIAGDGSVTEVLPRSHTATLPADLVACVRNVSAQWRFPAKGSPLAFDVPLRLEPR